MPAIELFIFFTPVYLMIILHLILDKRAEKYLQSNYYDYWRDKIYGQKPRFVKQVSGLKKDEDIPHDEYLNRYYKIIRFINYFGTILFILLVIFYYLIV